MTIEVMIEVVFRRMVLYGLESCNANFFFQVNEEHVGIVMEALSHRRGEVADMGPVPGHVGRTRLSMICPSRFVTLDVIVIISYNRSRLLFSCRYNIGN